MTITETLTAWADTPERIALFRPPLHRLRLPGKLRSLSSYGNTTSALKAALAEGPGTLIFDVLVPHDQTSIAQAIQVPSYVAVLPPDWDADIWLSAGVAGTLCILEVPLTTKGSIWAVNVTGNGNMAAAGHPIFHRSGCEFIGLRVEGANGVSSQGISARTGGGTYRTRAVRYRENQTDYGSGSGANMPPSGSVFEFIGTRHKDGLLRGHYLLVGVPSWTVREMSAIFYPPSDASYGYQCSWFGTADRENFRYTNPEQIGSLALGNGLAHQTSRYTAKLAPNGTTDQLVFHAADGLRRRLTVSAGSGEASWSTSLKSDDIITELSISIEADTGVAIGARAVSPITRPQTVVTNILLDNVLVIDPALDRANEHLGGNAEHPGGGRHGIIADEVDGLSFLNTRVFGKAGAKMRFILSGSEAANVDTNGVTGRGALQGFSSIDPPN